MQKTNFIAHTLYIQYVQYSNEDFCKRAHNDNSILPTTVSFMEHFKKKRQFRTQYNNIYREHIFYTKESSETVYINIYTMAAFYSI